MNEGYDLDEKKKCRSHTFDHELGFLPNNLFVQVSHVFVRDYVVETNPSSGFDETELKIGSVEDIELQLASLDELEKG